MGLLYPYPIDDKDQDHVKFPDNGIELSTYGLPYIFWAYLLGYLLLVGFLSFAIYEPANKLMSTPDPINKFIVYSLWGTVFGVTLGFLSLFFLHFKLYKNGKTLIKTTHIFWIPVLKKTYELKSKDSLHLNHFEGTPNVAKIQDIPEMRGHQNKGYFELFAELSNGKKVLIDRHSQKRELKKLMEILVAK